MDTNEQRVNQARPARGPYSRRSRRCGPGRGRRIGDECNFIYGTTQGGSGQFFNQVINGHNYLTQEEFSNSSLAASGGGCLQHP